MLCVALLVCVGLGQCTIYRNGIQDDSERWGLKHGLYAMEEQHVQHGIWRQSTINAMVCVVTLEEVLWSVTMLPQKNSNRCRSMYELH